MTCLMPLSSRQADAACDCAAVSTRAVAPAAASALTISAAAPAAPNNRLPLMQLPLRLCGFRKTPQLPPQRSLAVVSMHVGGEVVTRRLRDGVGPCVRDRADAQRRRTCRPPSARS